MDNYKMMLAVMEMMISKGKKDKGHE